MGKKRRWKELSTPAKLGVTVMGMVQIALAAAAWADLARRPSREVNGPKKLWAGVIGINYVGPILYFWKGCRRAG